MCSLCSMGTRGIFTSLIFTAVSSSRSDSYAFPLNLTRSAANASFLFSLHAALIKTTKNKVWCQLPEKLCWFSGEVVFMCITVESSWESGNILPPMSVQGMAILVLETHKVSLTLSECGLAGQITMDLQCISSVFTPSCGQCILMPGVKGCLYFRMFCWSHGSIRSSHPFVSSRRQSLFEIKWLFMIM